MEKKVAYSFKESMRGVFFLAYPLRKKIYLMVGLGLISAVGTAVVPYVIGLFFDSLGALEKLRTEETLHFSMGMLAVWLIIQAMNQSLGWVSRNVGREIPEKFQISVHHRSANHLLRMPISFHKQNKISEIRELIGQGGGRTQYMLMVGSDILIGLITVLLGISIAFTLHTNLALVLLAGALVYAFCMYFFIRSSALLQRDHSESWRVAMGATHMPISQVDSVKASVAEQHEQDRSRSLYDITLLKWVKMERVWSAVDGFQRLVVFIVQATIFSFSIYYIMLGEITLGTLVAFNGYALMFLGPLIQIGYSWQGIQNGFISAAAIMENIFDLSTEDYEPKDAVHAPAIKGSVNFQDVNFRYEEASENILKEVTFDVSAGETVAFVGESGVGKSTLISLIFAFYFPQEGSVTIDGINTRNFKLEELRSQIAMVPQEVALFNDTVEANIKYGSFSASREDVVKAAQLARADEFIEKLVLGYETVVGERGVKLSVGQKQRIAVARAILRNPKILILDEPTSALDSKTEKELTESLEKLMKGRTTFIIAHRLSTVRKADKIIVIEEGRVAEIGKHEELIRKEGGRYRMLYEHHIGLHE